MRRNGRDLSPSRAIAAAGGLFFLIGLVGITVWPTGFVLWVILIASGVAAVPRVLIEWWKERKRAG
jgi:hypothetical protein